MENATKALIIAGSILIAIILIAIGIKLATAPSNVAKKLEDTSSDLEASVFNSQFDQYFGSNKPGAQVKSLISQILANDAENKEHMVYFSIWKKGVNLNKDDETKPLNDYAVLYVHNAKSVSGQQNKLTEALAKVENSRTYTVKITPKCCDCQNGPGYKNGYIYCIAIIQEQD